MLYLLMIIGVLAAEQNPAPYRKLAGQTHQVCGQVVTFAPPDKDGDGCELRLDFGSPYWKPSFYVLIPERLRAEFGGRPEQRFFGQQVCVTGQVRIARRIAHIVLESPAHVFVQEEKAVPRFGDGAHRPCEQGAVAPKLTREVRPNYPSEDLVRRRIEDRLLLEAVVGTDGAVSDVRTLYSEVRAFEPPAEAAIRQWRFEPGTLNGTAVPMIVQVEMRFVLR